MFSTSTATPAQKKLFWACFVALVATSFTFILRIMALGEIATEFGLSETQKGEILGVGIWPFAVSIVLFSLIIDKIGYGKAILFAFLTHVAFAVLTVTATGYWSLYIGSALGGLAAGAIEAAINPLVATVFRTEKTKWLNILHAGWPGGLVLAGILALLLGGEIGWKGEILLVLLPVVAYGLMMLRCEFPASERVVAGVSYRDMLKEVGLLGMLITSVLIFRELGRVFGWPDMVGLAAAGAVSLGFFAYVRSLGNPLFVILMLVMIPLAITELGTDSWISSLMEPPMRELGLAGGWVLVYTAALMMVLRFYAGSFVHRLSPLGLLAASAGLAIVGLLMLSSAAGILILVAATVYGLGKTFFWPTMLGVVSEQCPKGGALTLNMIGGIGMLSAGVLGNALLGNIQDKEVDHVLLAERPALHAEVIGEEQRSIFGAYRAVDQARLDELSEEERGAVAAVRDEAKKSALKTVAVFPAVMLLSYLALMAWFRARGGYHPVTLIAEPPHAIEP